jgi:hypothetical protein
MTLFFIILFSTIQYQGHNDGRPTFKYTFKGPMTMTEKRSSQSRPMKIFIQRRDNRVPMDQDGSIYARCNQICKKNLSNTRFY